LVGGWHPNLRRRHVEAGQDQAEGHRLRRRLRYQGGRGLDRWRQGLDASRTQQAFREWSLPVTLAAGSHELKVRATSAAGEIQPMEPRWNPAGYLRNVIETVRVTAAVD